jgi:3-oxoacyl-[acyl-carrier protein] reductase
MNGLEVVVAGGTGGLGSVAVRLLAAEGARVIASYRSNAERAREVADVATIVQADLVRAADRRRLLDAAKSLYALVVFSGDPARVGSGDDLEGAMQRSHDVNYLGPVLLAREAADRMKAEGTPGAIVLVSTMQAVALFPGSTAYAGAKAALVHAARVLAKECRGRANVRVNVVCPGVNDAGMAKASIASGKYNSYLEQGFVPRFGHADDVARVVRFFLQPDNYVTGQVLTVDGGLTL